MDKAEKWTFEVYPASTAPIGELLQFYCDKYGTWEPATRHNETEIRIYRDTRLWRVSESVWMPLQSFPERHKNET